MKPIPGYEGLYSITSCGRVYGHKRKKFLKVASGNNGYMQVLLCKGCKPVNYYIHRLVALAYIPNPNNLSEVNHKDEIKKNNYASNLEWCTRSYNLNYGSRNERISRAKLVSEKSIRKPVYAIELDRAFPSISAAGKALNIQSNNISAHLKGRLKSAGGYHWRYAE